jgi:hypothetical protein
MECDREREREREIKDEDDDTNDRIRRITRITIRKAAKTMMMGVDGKKSDGCASSNDEDDAGSIQYKRRRKKL